ncbi:hypothetical protein MCHK_11725 (plasmid) [Mesorhizobium huakuii 7653R]|nr:hypothetical protein MCHK_11725 [Mesorhizobium huakuii 7653R]
MKIQDRPAGRPRESARIDAALAPLMELLKAYRSLSVVYALAELLDVCRAKPSRPVMLLSTAVKHQMADALVRLRSASVPQVVNFEIIERNNHVCPAA